MPYNQYGALDENLQFAPEVKTALFGSTEMRTALTDFQKSSRGFSEINVLSYGADPTGVADSTTAINDAIKAAKTFNVGSVFIPAGRYLINGTIQVTHELTLRGQYTGYTPTSGDRVSGTVLVAGDNASGAPVVEVKNSATDGYLGGTNIKDFFILGSAGWTSGSGAKDRVGLSLYKVISEYSISGIMITGFLRQGLKLQEVWDGTMSNVRIMYCGTDGTYAALDLTQTAQGNVNSLHAFGLHIEHCPYILRIAGQSRHNQFVACKFELNGVSPMAHPITITDSIENAFIGCYFVSRSADDFTYGAVAAQPAFIRVDGVKAHVIISSSFFTTAGYTSGDPLVDPTDGKTYHGGARWARVTSGKLRISDCEVDAAWGGSGGAPFRFESSGSSFVDSTIYTGAKGGLRNLFLLNSENQIRGLDIRPIDAAKAVTAGALFECTGARNLIGPNTIQGQTARYLLASTQQTIQPSSTEAVIYSSGTSLDFGWVDRFASNWFALSMTDPTSVTEFVKGWIGREVTVRFANANTTLVHSAAKLALKGAVNVTPPANSIMKFIALNDTLWVEVSRNF